MTRTLRYLALVCIGGVAGALMGGAWAQAPQPSDEEPAQLERRFDHRADGGEVPYALDREPGLGGGADAGLGEAAAPEAAPLPKDREDSDESL